MSAVLSSPPIPIAPAMTAVRRPRGWTLGLVAIGVVTLVLTGWQVWAGTPSEYYASIALSMSRSWSNFFFGAVDPAGTVTLDKIPGSFWVPALFVRVFGYSAWAVILPNALAAVGAALVTALAARRLAGVRAGLLAGAIVAVTPILVAVARSNQPEAFFVLGLSLTAYAAVRAVQERSAGWLIAAGAFVGLSFQFYMLEAWAVWPALAAAYLCTRQSWARRIAHLAVAGAVSLVASLWWVAIVSFFPTGSRPYIGSTLTDDPWEMVFGYNGLGRFSATADSTAYESFTPPFSGDPGICACSTPSSPGRSPGSSPPPSSGSSCCGCCASHARSRSRSPCGSRPSRRCSRRWRGCTSSTRPPSPCPSASSSPPR